MDQLKLLLSRFTLKQQITLGAAGIGVILLIFWMTKWSQERDFKVLYSGLAPEDAGAVLAKVRENGVEFRLAEGGSSIMVPSGKVAELRLQLAAAGIPKSGRIGFELFDKTNFSATDFTEQINYHRALEGELERSVMSLSEVEVARVHVTFAKDSVFTESQQPAKASILVKLRPGAKLTAQNVQAICNLTSSAVEGLQPEAVSVVDMHGNVLNRPRKGGGPDSPEASEASLDFRQKVEHDLLAKVDATLEPLLGAGRYRAGVNVECDFSSGEQSEETFDPTKSVMVTSQKTEDSSGGSTASGVPGTASNLPRPTSRPGGGNSPAVSRRTENIAYQSSRTVRHTRLPQGNLKRISASVLVDYGVHWQGTGAKAKRLIEAPAPERLKSIHDLVAAAIGFTPDRGDQLVIESLPFESTLNAEPAADIKAIPPPPSGLPPWLENLIRGKNTFIVGASAGALVLLLLVGVLKLLFGGKKKSDVEVSLELGEAGSRPAIPAGPPVDFETEMEARLAEQAALKERQTLDALDALKIPTVTTKKTEILSRHIGEDSKKDPQAMAQVVRSWLTEEDH